MKDILAFLQPIQNSVSKTTLRQSSRIIVAMIAMTGRVTMLGLSRWTEKGGSYWKSIFLDKPLWQTERLESYQYFNQAEFSAAFGQLGLEICELRTMTVNYDKWRREVEIETEGIDFPTEHVLVVSKLPYPVKLDK